MKLRNKKTGEIVELARLGGLELWADDRPKAYSVDSYDSLVELCEEWEDYEEPKEHWYIDYRGYVYVLDPESVPNYSREAKQIGNYFETKEEAERAVEKLEAWERLKNRGFRFDGYNACSIDYDIDEQYRRYISEDLDLLFGGEE